MDQKFSFLKLDGETRGLMMKEITAALQAGELYFSARFNETGLTQWPDWLLTAAELHDEHWLAFQIESNSAMKHLETRAKPSGGYTTAHVPDTAAETMAEGQFNRFYLAAICLRAIEDGQGNVRIYRARHRANPRPESHALEGTETDANMLLAEVRNKSQSLKCELLKPNSGLSIDY
jgi:hypothetical protein